MQHIGIDLGSMESQLCTRSADGGLLWEERIKTTEIGALLEKEQFSRVILESCSEAFLIADTLKEQGHEVRIVPATMVRALGVAHRGIKTDRRDAQILSEVSTRVELPSVHIRSLQARDWKTQLGMRQALVEVRTKLINCIRGWLRTNLSTVRSGVSESFPTRVREAMEKRDDGTPAHVELVLLVLDEINKRIREADILLALAAESDPICKLLQTVPGVGVLTAMYFVWAVDNIERFANAHALESYLGITPGENSTGFRRQVTSITKAGPPQVRRMLNQACWVMLMHRPDDPLVKWAKRVAARRGKKVAVVAMSRKLAGILYAMWRDGTSYHHKKSAALKEGAQEDVQKISPKRPKKTGRRQKPIKG